MGYTVYVHTSPSKKKYVGITKQKVKERWRNGKGYNSNIYFSNAVEKYGWDNFKHEIIAENLSEKDAKLLEIRLIKEFKSDNRQFGYNITKGGDPCNKGLSDEDRKIHRYESQKKWQEKNKEKHMEYRRKYDKSEKRKAYVNALNKTEKRKEHRREYMREYRKTHREEIRQITKKSRKKNHPYDSRKKGVLVYDKSMKLLYEFDSLKSASETLGYHKNNVSEFLRGKKNCVKYIFRYKEMQSIE